MSNVNFFLKSCLQVRFFCHSVHKFVCILVAVEKIEMKKPPEMTPGNQGSTGYQVG